MHGEAERQLMLDKKPERVIVLDQGSRSGPRVVADEQVKCLIIDHHNATENDFPKDAEVSSAIGQRKRKLSVIVDIGLPLSARSYFFTPDL